MRLSLLLRLLFALAIIGITPARADEAADAKAAAGSAYKAGMAHFQLEEYDAAIQKFQEGFRLEPAPEFLYNIAQAYRLSKRPDKAVSYYQKYLRMRPAAENRAEVERWIDECKLAAATQKSAPSAAPPAAAAPSPSPPSAQPAAPGESTTTLVAAAPPHKRPVYKTGWFWGVVAGGAVVVAGAVVLGVVLSSPSDNAKSLPALTFP